MMDYDVIVCFELPCHAQQSRTYREQADDPFVIPVFLCESSLSRATFPRGPSLFGYPFVVVVDRQQATSCAALYDAVVERLQRWTVNARDLFTWEARLGPATKEDLMEEVDPSLVMNGTVAHQEGAIDERDIADEKSVIMEDSDAPMDAYSDVQPCRVSTKKNVFQLRLQNHHMEYGAAAVTYGSDTPRFISWESRQQGDALQPILRKNDAFFCEFDENMKAYYFGDDRSRWEHARWEIWEQFNHPEYEEAIKSSAEKKNNGISLQDCLDEFTKVGVT
jgi:ubiquitin carboxyl-terminal hydrolase 4/11/15